MKYINAEKVPAAIYHVSQLLLCFEWAKLLDFI